MIRMRTGEKTQIVNVLYVAAIAACLAGLLSAILAVTSQNMDAASGSTKAVTFLTRLMEGLFAGGVIAGFAAYFLSGSTSAVGGTNGMCAVLRIGAFLLFLMGILAAGLSTKEMADSASGSAKALHFLSGFVRFSLLYAGVLAGLAALAASRSATRAANAGAASGVLLVAAALALILGIAMAGLTVAEMSEAATGSDKAASFLFVLLHSGLLYGGILGGLGLLVSSRS